MRTCGHTNWPIIDNINNFPTIPRKINEKSKLHKVQLNRKGGISPTLPPSAGGRQTTDYIYRMSLIGPLILSSNRRRSDSLSKMWMIKQYQAAYLMLHIQPDSRGEEENSHLPGSLSGIVTFLKYSTRNLSENPICCSNISPHQILCLFAQPNVFHFPGSGHCVPYSRF